jgi:predicted nucleotidyltransferase
MKKSCGRTARAEELGHAVGERIEELKAIREDLCRIAAAHGASNVRVFGSVGRGEQDASSDLDLLVDMAGGRSLFDLIALSNDLEESLGVDVDVLTEASLSPYIRDRVLEEAVAL